MKVHVHVHRRAIRPLRRQVDVFNQLAAVVEVVAVDVEERVERGVEALSGKNGRRGDTVLAVNENLNVVPGFVRAVVDGQPAAVKPKWIDGRCLPAPERAQAENRNRGGYGRKLSSHGL